MRVHARPRLRGDRIRRSMPALGLGRVKTRWRGDLIEWIIFSIANFAAKIVMRDGFGRSGKNNSSRSRACGVFTQPGSWNEPAFAGVRCARRTEPVAPMQ